VPFVNQDLVWDFRLEKVVSINVSGHKYGLVSILDPVVMNSEAEFMAGLSRSWLGRLALPRIPPPRTRLQH
jgi:glutamate/tyrosine decarboxylase-like PLP-dependent enzyme